MAVNQTLKTASGSNVLTSDPDRNLRRTHTIGGTHSCLSGRRVFDLAGIHYNFALEFNYMSAALYEALRELYYSGEMLYFDDGNVPPLIETQVYQGTSTLNYTGISNPSGTHIGYTDQNADSPTAKDDFESVEFSTFGYGKVAPPGSNWFNNHPGMDEYGYFKFAFLSPAARENIVSFSMEVWGGMSCVRPEIEKGFRVLGWNGLVWVEFGRITEGVFTNIYEISYSTTDPEIAKTFVDANDSYIRLLFQTLASNDATSDFFVWINFAQAVVNAEEAITLTHTPILSSGDVIWVKNLTTAQTLTLTTDYTVSGKVVTVSGQNDDDVIEVKYNRYFEVKFDNVPEDWLSGDPASARNRAAVVTLSTLTGSAVDS